MLAWPEQHLNLEQQPTTNPGDVASPKSTATWVRHVFYGLAILPRLIQKLPYLQYLTIQEVDKVQHMYMYLAYHLSQQQQ